MFPFGKRKSNRSKDRESSREELPEAHIGYKFANPDPRGFRGLAKGKPYGAVEEVSAQSMGFHSYKTIGELFANIPPESRGVFLLEVLHYGEVREYDSGYVSTGQRVLQVSNASRDCRLCDSSSEYFVATIFGGTLSFCRPHRAAMPKISRLLTRAKPQLIDERLEEMARSQLAAGVKFIRPWETLEPTPHRKPE